jgi:hypothetical protein
MPKDVVKASITLKAESLPFLIEALTRIAEDANMLIVMQATITTALAIESEDASDLGLAISDIAGAVERTDGVECKVSAPGSVWHGMRLDPTPMERMINQATEPESTTLSHNGRSVTLTAETARNASAMLQKNSELFK